MKSKVYNIEGKETSEIELPKAFAAAIRPDIIKRAFLSIKSKEYQIKGTDPKAGLRTSATYAGRRKKVYRTSMNIGKARLPRVKAAQGRWGEARRAPQTKGGRRAHPPKTEKIIIEKINKKENKKAIISAISATAIIEWVKKRGHKLGKIKDLPIIIEDKLQEIKKTKDAKSILTKLNIDEDLKRAEAKKIKAGVGKTRGRKYKKKKSALIVIKEDKGIKKALKNVPGIDIATVKELNAELLAPGGDPGRLAIYTKSAIEEIKKM